MRKSNMHVRLPATLLHEPLASAATAAFAACMPQAARECIHTLHAPRRVREKALRPGDALPREINASRRTVC